MSVFDYQSNRHCAKTRRTPTARRMVFDYQSNRHCAKTDYGRKRREEQFDYQSNRHCAKTAHTPAPRVRSLITSQIDTAPKLPVIHSAVHVGLITSQIDTAPKRRYCP